MFAQLLYVANWFVPSPGTVFYSFRCMFCLCLSPVRQAVGRGVTSMGDPNVSMSSVQYLLFFTHLLKVDCVLSEVCVCVCVSRD